MCNIHSEGKSPRWRVMLVDDHATTRLGLIQIISREPGLEVCGEVSGVNDALLQIADIRPDLAVIDLSLNDGSGLDLIREIHHLYPKIKILTLSMYRESLFADRALKAGAMGYLCKDEAIGCVIEAIRQIMNGKIYLTEVMRERVLRQRVCPVVPGDGSFTNPLSNRELEIFQLIGNGQTRSQIARHLHLSVKTVETHQENIKKKLNLDSKLEMTCKAVTWVLEEANLHPVTGGGGDGKPRDHL